MKIKFMLVGLLTAAMLLAMTACSYNKPAANSSGGASQPAGAAGIHYPKKPITMVVPYGAGGTTDLIGRQFAIQLSKQLGQSITVVNQGGASGSVGCKTVLDANPDGYTILYTAESLGTQRVMGISEMSYNDFAPIITVANDPKVIVANKSSPYNTLEDLTNDMMARPGKVKMSYTGPGGSGHIQALIYNKFGLDMAMTAYAGGNDCIVAVLGEQVDFTNSNFSTVVGYIESGDLKLLGISANERLGEYSTVPTLAEVIPEAAKHLEMPFTPLSLLVDRDVPAQIQEVLRAASQKVVEQEDWKNFVAENCLETLYDKYTTVEAMNAFYTGWESLASWLLYDAGAAPNSPAQFGIAKP